MVADTAQRWMDSLDEEDLAFVRRFIVASGSLKELARVYDVSYPTVRLRLDRLIQKIEVFERFQAASDIERRLRGYYAEGRIPGDVFRSLLAACRKQKETGK
jgi:hypothetical protein